MKGLLEVCVDSTSSAISAYNGGADRLELCSGLVIGGITPTLSIFEQVKGIVSIPINVLIRPRFADFCYNEYEKQIILDDIAMFKKAGANGVVIGALLPNGELDIEFLKKCVEYASGIDVTLHRAFDVCIDPYKALEQVKQIGISTILTSGQESDCYKGRELIKNLIIKAEDKVCILVGGGVNDKIIEKMYDYTKATAYHMSGKIVKESKMEYRKDNVPMGIDSLSEFEIYQTDEQKVKKAKTMMDNLYNYYKQD